MNFYAGYGHVRGHCGHTHRTLKGAHACVQRDLRACQRQGGGAYSDRIVGRVDGEPLSDAEIAELIRLREES